jgi:hypothetical protein
MYLIQYEKENLKTHIIYNILDEQLDFILSSDNGFQQAYINNDNIIVRIHYKFITYNEPINSSIDNILDELNKSYKTESIDWTITLKEIILNKQHKVYYYFYSNKYCSYLKNLKSSIHFLKNKYIYVDDSIYYMKYKDFIKAEIPYQSDYSKKYYKHYKLFHGHIKNSLLSSTQNLKMYLLEC